MQRLRITLYYQQGCHKVKPPDCNLKLDIAVFVKEGILITTSLLFSGEIVHSAVLKTVRLVLGQSLLLRALLVLWTRRDSEAGCRCAVPGESPSGVRPETET